VLFLTAGSGVTPVMSMLRTLARRDQITDIVHLHSAPTEADVIFADELAQLAKDHPGYQLRVRATRAEGRLDLSKLDDEVADWRTREAWACGPEAMLHDAEREYDAAGLGVRLHLERFAASRAAVEGTGGSVTFERSGKTVVADAATSLMEAGEQAGVQMPFGCRMGICQSCVVGCWRVTRGICGPERNANREAGFRRAFRLRPAIVCWIFNNTADLGNIEFAVWQPTVE